jgi:type II restriction enzyme
MNVNYTELIKNVKGTFVQKPLSGTLSGHSAGEPFDKHVYRNHFVEQVYRRSEYMIEKYAKIIRKMQIIFVTRCEVSL